MTRLLLNDQAAIVSGGGKGIGRAIAVRLAEEGAAVAGLPLIPAQAELGGKS